jgi:hypothetical protein
VEANILDDFGEKTTDLTSQVSVLEAVSNWKISRSSASKNEVKKKIGYSTGQKLWGVSFDGEVWKYNDRNEYQFIFSKEIIKVENSNTYENFCKNIPRRLRESYRTSVEVSDLAEYDSMFTTYLDADVRSGTNYIRFQCTFHKVANNKVSGSIFIMIKLDDDFVGVKAPIILTCDQSIQMVDNGRVGPIMKKPHFKLALDPNREAVLSQFDIGEIVKYGPKYILSEKKEHRRGKRATKFTFSLETYEYLIESEEIGENKELTVLGKCR